MSEIIPAILPRSTEELKQKLDHIPEEIPLIHIDVVDNKIFFDPVQDFEVHLMVPDPDERVDEWVNAGAKRVITHKLSEKILKLRPGVEIGLGVDLSMSLEDVFPHISNTDFIQLMSIREIGEQGHPFEIEIFDRIKLLKEKFPEVL